MFSAKLKILLYNEKTFVVGDIHGAYKALIQVLERSGFNNETDSLISVGDIADGWSETVECYEKLMSLKDFIMVMGNHDYWLYEWLQYGAAPNMWLNQGGKASIKSYIKRIEKDEGSSEIMMKHLEFLRNKVHYFYKTEGKLFVHGGFNHLKPLLHTSKEDMMWDRNLFYYAQLYHQQGSNSIVKEFDEVFIGHTATNYAYTDMKPVNVSNVWNIDQGAGWSGKLTIMDINTKEYWQSDIVKSLYPKEKGR